MKYFCFLLFASLLFISCDKPKNSTKELEEIFTVEEIKDLHILVDFFESKLQNHDKDLPTAYKKLLLRRIKYDVSDSYLNDFKEQDLEKVFSKIDSSTFNEIWRKSIRSNIRRKVKVVVNTPSENGRYIKFLKRIQPKYPKVQEYIHNIIMADNNYSSAKYMFAKYDFKKEKPIFFESFNDFYVRLIITISELDFINNHYRTKDFYEKIKNK